MTTEIDKEKMDSLFSDLYFTISKLNAISELVELSSSSDLEFRVERFDGLAAILKDISNELDSIRTQGEDALKGSTSDDP